MPAKPSHSLADFLSAVDDLAQANHAFSKRELSPVAHKDAREGALAYGLGALARHCNVTLKAPLQVDSRGEFMIAAAQDGDGVATINPYNGTNVFGAAFVGFLKGFGPRTGTSPLEPTMEPEAVWCYMNHFGVEKMLVAAAQRLKAEALDPESLKAELEIVTVRGETDTDEEGQERFTPPGSAGRLVANDVPGQWEAHFGDAAVHIRESDLFDPSKYQFRSHFHTEARSLLDDFGVTVAPDRDQPSLWIWYAPSDSCEASFATEGEAIDDAFAGVMEQAQAILSVAPEGWAKMPLNERMESARGALMDDNLPIFAER